MTNEEASIIIGNIPINGDECYTISEYQQAKAMAIKALEQQPCEDAVSRQAVLETIDVCNSDGLKGIFWSYDDGERFKAYIKDLPPVTPKQQTCEDAISRHDALNCVTFNEVRYRMVEDIKALPSVTPKSKSEYEHDHEVVKAYNDGQVYILDKIRAEIENDWQFKQFPRSPWSCGLRRAIEIIDKYRGDTDGNINS